MKKIIAVLGCVFLLSISSWGQQQKTQVMTLGVFHFNFSNADVIQIDKSKQIDVLEAEHQKEINSLVNSILKFNPTKIIIEAPTARQKFYDSIYTAYVSGQHILGRNEIQQIGFRIAKQLHHTQLYCADTDGRFYESLNYLNNETDTNTLKFDNYYYNNPDSLYFQQLKKPIFTPHGIIADFIERNNPDTIKTSLAYYLLGIFKFEQTQGDYTGVDFETGRWFNRNLRIYRNIQRCNPTPNDRLLVIFGSDHLNILNYLFDASLEYQLVSPLPYLRESMK